MIHQVKKYASIGLLALWCSVQLIDSWHHIHEAHETNCATETSHFCEPHAEVELCGLCTVVHGSAIQTIAFQSSSQVHFSSELILERPSKALNVLIQNEISRGPPSLI